MKIHKIIIFYWLPVIAWAFVIFSFSSQPSIATSEIRWKDFIVKKTAHFVEYMVFSILLYRAFRVSEISKAKAIISSVIISVLYAASDEIHQSFTPGREPRLRDVFIDTIGASFGGYFIWSLQHKMPNKLKTLAKNMGLA